MVGMEVSSFSMSNFWGINDSSIMSKRSWGSMISMIIMRITTIANTFSYTFSIFMFIFTVCIGRMRISGCFSVISCEVSFFSVSYFRSVDYSSNFVERSWWSMITIYCRASIVNLNWFSYG